MPYPKDSLVWISDIPITREVKQKIVTHTLARDALQDPGAISRPHRCLLCDSLLIICAGAYEVDQSYRISGNALKEGQQACV